MIQPPKTYAVRKLSARGWEWVNAVGSFHKFGHELTSTTLIETTSGLESLLDFDLDDWRAREIAGMIHDGTITNRAQRNILKKHLEKRAPRRDGDGATEAALAARNAQGKN